MTAQTRDARLDWAWRLASKLVDGVASACHWGDGMTDATNRIANELRKSAPKQLRVAEWVGQVFDEKTAQDGRERVLRMVEEALELAQAVGIDPWVAERLVNYVYERPKGDPAQEVAGTMVTLYAAAAALGIDADAAFEKELARVHQPEVIDRIRRRQAEKRAALVIQKMCPDCGGDGIVQGGCVGTVEPCCTCEMSGLVPTEERACACGAVLPAGFDVCLDCAARAAFDSENEL